MNLKKTVEGISTFMNQILGSFSSLVKIIILYKKSSISIVGKNQDLCILANGPSLKSSLENNFTFIENKEKLVVNFFGQSEYFALLKPKHYCFLDAEFFYNKNTEHTEKLNVLFDSIQQKVNWEITIYVPNIYKKSAVIALLTTNKHVKIEYFNYIVINTFEKFKFYLFSKNIGMPQCENVLGLALFLGINKGFKNIYLFGTDHSWHESLQLKANNTVLLNDQHFYNLNKNEVVIQATVSSFFLSLHKAFKGYEILKKYADYRKVNIYNASSKSYIDVFEKIKLN